MARKMLEREASPERSKIWIDRPLPKPNYKATECELKVPVIYYLSRNGQLEHPHLMEVPISSPHGMLCLKDVIHRLSVLRGLGIPNMYSWSAKRSYKNGFVWQDLSMDDFIHPSSGHEYVLKGTQLLLETSLSFRSCETISSAPSSKSSSVTNNSISSMDIADSPAFYKAKTCREFAVKAANASTQTEEKCGRQRNMEREKVEECKEGSGGSLLPFSGSSFGVLEGSLEGNGSADIRNLRVENERASGRLKASAVLMHLIRCGSSD